MEMPPSLVMPSEIAGLEPLHGYIKQGIRGAARSILEAESEAARIHRADNSCLCSEATPKLCLMPPATPAMDQLGPKKPVNKQRLRAVLQTACGE